MASPFAIVQNATATFTLPAAGTVTDSLGNVRPATTTYEVDLFLRADTASQPVDMPGIDPITSTLTGYAVDPMALDAKVTRGTRGTLEWNGQAWTIEVQGVRERYGNTGMIADLLAQYRGDDIRLLLLQQA